MTLSLPDVAKRWGQARRVPLLLGGGFPEGSHVTPETTMTKPQPFSDAGCVFQGSGTIEYFS